MRSWAELLMSFFDRLSGNRTMRTATEVRRRRAQIHRRLAAVHEQSSLMLLSPDERERLESLKQALNGRK